MNTILTIQNLHSSIDDKKILKGINITVKPGEVHAIMGPNGSGKSTFAAALAGREDIQINQGTIALQEKSTTEMKPDERARAGLFLGFQHPVEIPGISTFHFLKTALNEHRIEQGKKPLDAVAFLEHIKPMQKLFDLSNDMLKRSVNEGFSGGEKKKNEMFQMAVLNPTLAVLDETDSGLDIDALKTIGEGINKLRSNKNGIILITHYQRILDYIKPDFVHILKDGKITQTGGIEIAQQVENQGYNNEK